MSSQVNIWFENDMKCHVSLELSDKSILHNIDNKEPQLFWHWPLHWKTSYTAKYTSQKEKCKETNNNLPAESLQLQNLNLIFLSGKLAKKQPTSQPTERHIEKTKCLSYHPYVSNNKNYKGYWSDMDLLISYWNSQCVVGSNMLSFCTTNCIMMLSNR